jgi:putative transposase
MINKAHKIKLYPTKSQKVFFAKSFGVARFTYNWALTKWKEDYKQGIKQDARKLIKHLNSIKKEQFSWMQETGKCSSQYAIYDLESAFKKMWKENKGHPNFKKKGDKDSFLAIENEIVFKQKDGKIWIPRLGWVKCAEDLRFEGKVNNVVISRVADMYFASVNIISNEVPVLCESQAKAGVDLGIKSLIVCSNGKTFDNPKSLKKGMKALKRLQRGLCRKQKGSNSRKKQKMKIAKKHYRITCIRKSAIHEATSYLVNNFKKIVIETLKPKNMMKNHHLAQAVSDAAFGEVKRQLEYKCVWKGVELVKADQWFPSSKLCSCCGHKKEVLKLNERVYHCDVCGHTQDRDLNAAINLANYSPTQGICGSEAVGERTYKPRKVKSSSVKTEINNSIKSDFAINN